MAKKSYAHKNNKHKEDLKQIDCSLDLLFDLYL
jgi:hypothetical protein